MAERVRDLTPEEWDGLADGSLELRSWVEEREERQRAEEQARSQAGVGENIEADQEENETQNGDGAQEARARTAENPVVVSAPHPNGVAISQIPEPKMLGEWLKGTAFGVAIGCTIGALAAYAAVRIIVDNDRKGSE